jgi:hypothetical protein
MPGSVKEVGQILNTTEPKAQHFCMAVQSCLCPRLPLHIVAALVADFLEQSPHTDPVPEEIAIHICHKYPRMQYTSKRESPRHSEPNKPNRSKSESTTSSRTPQEKPARGFSADPGLVGAVADLIPDEDRGNREKARQFIIDLERRYPHCRKLSSNRLLSAIKRARREGSLQMEQVVIEVRKQIYGYHGHPDEVRVIYTPMGGKTGR